MKLLKKKKLQLNVNRSLINNKVLLLFHKNPSSFGPCSISLVLHILLKTQYKNYKFYRKQDQNVHSQDIVIVIKFGNDPSKQVLCNQTKNNMEYVRILI